MEINSNKKYDQNDYQEEEDFQDYDVLADNYYSRKGLANDPKKWTN